jgi:hypothetical protein
MPPKASVVTRNKKTVDAKRAQFIKAKSALDEAEARFLASKEEHQEFRAHVLRCADPRPILANSDGHSWVVNIDLGGGKNPANLGRWIVVVRWLPLVYFTKLIHGSSALRALTKNVHQRNTRASKSGIWVPR